MKRREFIALLGGAAAWPRAARAQQPDERVRRVGVLLETAEDDKERNGQFAKFREGLASFGWVEGRTVHIEQRFAAADAGRYEPLAKELVALQPEVILAVSTPVTAALQRQTSTIPIVFLGVSDPIGSGFAANLARPGSNLTGIMLYEAGVTGKWLGMLKEIAPRLTRVALSCSSRLGTLPFCLVPRSKCSPAPHWAANGGRLIDQKKGRYILFRRSEKSSLGSNLSSATRASIS
jgi:putative tryptophan/tyrosine transport system substrate-binding protein